MYNNLLCALFYFFRVDFRISAQSRRSNPTPGILKKYKECKKGDRSSTHCIGFCDLSFEDSFWKVSSPRPSRTLVWEEKWVYKGREGIERIKQLSNTWDTGSRWCKVYHLREQAKRVQVSISCRPHHRIYWAARSVGWLVMYTISCQLVSSIH